VTQHAGLSAERWSQFSVDQQILMIGNEMNRAAQLLGAGDGPSRSRSYERVLRLVDLTVEVNDRYGLRRELLRWRDLVAALYLESAPEPAAHAEAFRALLLLNPVAARQIPFVLG
jgi:hypothetical protein